MYYIYMHIFQKIYLTLPTLLVIYRVYIYIPQILGDIPNASANCTVNRALPPQSRSREPWLPAPVRVGPRMVMTKKRTGI